MHLRGAQIKVSLRQAVASNSSPDCCIEWVRVPFYDRNITGEAAASPVVFGAATGLDLHLRGAQIKVSLRQAVASNSPPDCCIEWVRVPFYDRNITGEAAASPVIFGAGNRTRTCTLSQWNLNPPSLPIPPCPHIQLFISVGTMFDEMTSSKSTESFCCGARQPLRPAVRACVLPTAATRSAR